VTWYCVGCVWVLNIVNVACGLSFVVAARDAEQACAKVRTAGLLMLAVSHTWTGGESEKGEESTGASRGYDPPRALRSQAPHAGGA
jgi:hypothetical protein